LYRIPAPIFLVTYICCPTDCKGKCIELKRNETLGDERTVPRYRYEPIWGKVIRHGTTYASMWACSACPGGVGKEM
jgi:hypothetical protein